MQMTEIDDFTTATPSEIASFAERHSADFDCDVDRLDIVAAFAEERATLIARTYGFAVVQRSGALPFLWLLYIAPAHRGRGVGRTFVKEIVGTFDEYHMTLRCCGAARRRFFGRCGFVVESRDGDWRRMTTDREYRKWQ